MFTMNRVYACTLSHSGIITLNKVSMQREGEGESERESEREDGGRQERESTCIVQTTDLTVVNTNKLATKKHTYKH